LRYSTEAFPLLFHRQAYGFRQLPIINHYFALFIIPRAIGSFSVGCKRCCSVSALLGTNSPCTVKVPVVKGGLWDSTICFSQHSAWIIAPQEQLKTILLAKSGLPQTLQFTADHLFPFYKLYLPRSRQTISCRSRVYPLGFECYCLLGLLKARGLRLHHQPIC
jgi:hypothetical protein